MLKTFDNILDRTIIFSFSNIGFKIRKKIFRWDNSHYKNFSGKTIAITGPTSGIGKAVAIELAESGANLILLARNRSKLDALEDQLKPTFGNHKSILVDLSDLSSVRQAAAHLRKLEQLDIIIHNAGGLHNQRQVTNDGIELTLQTHVVAPHLINTIVLENATLSKGTKIISIASGGMYSQKVDLSDLGSEKDYKGSKAYARAKRIQIDLTSLWAKKEPQINFYALHPGWVDTPGLKHSLPKFYKIINKFLRNTSQGIDTMLWLCGTEPDQLNSGAFYHDRAVRSTQFFPKTDTTEKDKQILWQEIKKLSEH